MEEGEQVGRDRQRGRRRTEEGKVGCQRKEEAVEPQSQGLGEGEEVQGEGRGWGESWEGEKPWGEQEEGGLDSLGLELRILRHYT